MTKQKTTKRVLLSSVLSLVLCISMLIGTTFAWFTDSVTSVNNVIKAGNLDVDVYYGNVEEENSIEGVSTLFNSVARWEPGAVAYENLTVINKGTLALKYQMNVGFTNENYMVDGEYALSQILKVGFVEGGVEDGVSREEVLASVTEWKPMEDFTLNGELLAKTNDETIGMIIYWEPCGEDNNFNVSNGKATSDGKEYLHVDLGITLVATQLVSESDSFDKTYDENATYPAIDVATLEEGATEPLSLTVGNVNVKVPEDAPAGDYKLEITSYSSSADENGHTVVDANINLVKDGVAVIPGAATYDVSLKLDMMSHKHKLFHKDTEITEFTYDVFTGDLTFETTTFSPFSVNYDIFGTEVVVNEVNKKILSGFFKGVNPATYDQSLLGDNSEYIAVDYVKDGVKFYVVSERATTVILGDNDDGGSGYTFENGDYNVTMINDGVLYSKISALQNNAHSTVYILPGVYEEATTINVYSSMDVIGLGDAEDIKIIKVKGSYSNRHLINCNGAVTRSEHIQVTVRNLYLDASAKNLNSTGKSYTMDNAAVQAIRLSKVKCYDLIIAKSSGYAFYVQGKYDTRGTYMYAENCTMTTNSVVDTQSTYRFYYDNLTYGKGTYSNNTNYIKNKAMDWNDWEW